MRIVLCIILNFSWFAVAAQTDEVENQSKATWISEHIATQVAKNSEISSTKQHNVEKSSTTLGIAIQVLFKGYKSFISSQDGSSCSFHPSCSRYFVNATHQHGMIKGSLLFGDRFQRCNSLNRKNYPVYEPLMLLYDPVPTEL